MRLCQLRTNHDLATLDLYSLSAKKPSFKHEKIHWVTLDLYSLSPKKSPWVTLDLYSLSPMCGDGQEILELRVGLERL